MTARKKPAVRPMGRALLARVLELLSLSSARLEELDGQAIVEGEMRARDDGRNEPDGREEQGH